MQRQAARQYYVPLQLSREKSSAQQHEVPIVEEVCSREHAMQRLPTTVASSCLLRATTSGPCALTAARSTNGMRQVEPSKPQHANAGWKQSCAGLVLCGWDRFGLVADPPPHRSLHLTALQLPRNMFERNTRWSSSLRRRKLNFRNEKGTTRGLPLSV